MQWGGNKTMGSLLSVDRYGWMLPVVLFAYISLVPFYYLEPLVISPELPAFSWLKYLPVPIILLFAVAVAAAPSPRLSVRVRNLPAAGYAMGYVVVSLLSLKNADFLAVGLGKFVYYNMTGLVLFYLVVLYLDNWSVIKKTLGALIWIAGFVGFYTLCCALAEKDPIWGDTHLAHNPYYSVSRATGPFGSPTATASYLILFFPMFAWVYLHAGTTAARIAGLLLLPVTLVAIVFTHSRSAMLTLAIVVIAMVPLWRKTLSGSGQAGWSRLSRNAVVILAGALVVALGLFDSSGTHWVEIGERWRHLSDPRPVEIVAPDKVYRYGSHLEYTERFRIAQYYTTWNILGEQPLLGIGFGNFTRVFDQYKYTDNYMEWEFPYHTTDNMYLMFAAETGLVGVAVLLLFFAALGVGLYRAHGRVGEGERRDLLVAFMAAGGGILVNMSTWDALNEPTVRMTWAVGYWSTCLPGTR
jgi:hypothetical protein